MTAGWLKPVKAAAWSTSPKPTEASSAASATMS